MRPLMQSAANGSSEPVPDMSSLYALGQANFGTLKRLSTLNLRPNINDIKWVIRKWRGSATRKSECSRGLFGAICFSKPSRHSFLSGHRLGLRQGRIHNVPRLCTFDKDVATWGVPTRIVQTAGIDHDRTLASAIDQKQGRAACCTEPSAHGMSAISGTVEPAWLARFNRKVGLFDQNRREISAPGCLLAMSAMAVAHVSRRTC